MKFIFYTILTTLCFAFTNGLAQVNPKIETNNKQQLEICTHINNTFQIQVLNPRISPVIKVDICEIVISNRNDSAITYVNYSTNLVIKIYPKNQLSTLPKSIPLFIYEK